MEITNPGDFARYCQERADDEELPEIVELAERWTDYSLSLQRQYGGHGQGTDEWIGYAYARMGAEGIEILPEQIVKVREVVSRFWAHSEAFDKWFKSKVIVVQSSNS